MTTPRVDIAYRVITGANDDLTVNYNGAGAVTATIAPGLYMTAAALATAIDSALTTAVGAASWTVSGASGTWSIGVAANSYTLSFPDYSLRDWLGFTGNKTAAATQTGDGPCPGIYVGEFPWSIEDIEVTWPIKRWSGRHQKGGAQKYGDSRNELTVQAHLGSSDVAQWRTVQAQLLKGIPCTMWLDSSEGTSWAWATPLGPFQGTLAQGEVSEAQLTKAEDLHTSAILKFAEFTDPAITITDFDSALAAPELGLRFYLYVQGIGHIFIDGESPRAQTGSLWTAPTSKSRSFTLKPYTLDTSGGVKDVGSVISRRSGEVSPGSMRITLAEDDDGTLLDIFAREKATGALTTVTANIEYDTAGTGAAIDVKSSADFDSAGLAYIGRETIYHPTKAATTLGTGGNLCTRDVFNDPNGTGTTYGDITFQKLENSHHGPRTITNYPSIWLGRWVSLRAFIVDPFGRALGTAYDGAYTAEVWRGIVKQPPRPAKDWQRWDLQCSEISAILDTQVGREPINAMLLRIPASAKYNVDPTGLSPDFSHYVSHYISGSNSTLRITIKEYTSWPDTIVAEAELNISIPEGNYSVSRLEETIEAGIVAALLASGLSGGLYVFVNQKFGGNGGYNHHWRLVMNGNSTYEYDITFHYSDFDSIGKILGYTSDMSSSNKGTGTYGEVSHEPSWTVYIDEGSTRIPFFYVESNGLLETAPAAGFARIGGDEDGEVVKYSSIEDKTSILEGLYQLVVEKRGAFGTKPKEHKVGLGADWTDDASKVLVEFINGFDEVHPFTAIMNLAVSTGESGHHTAYDTLLARTSPPLDPQHFDVTQWAIDQADAGEIPLTQFILSKPKKLSEMIAGWLAPFGRFIYSDRGSDGLYRIRIGKMEPPLRSETATAIGASNLEFDDPVTWKAGLSSVVNHIIIKPSWDVIKEEATDDRINQLQPDSITDYGTKQKITWTLTGLKTDVSTVAGVIALYSARVFARLSKPYLVLELSTGREGLSLRPGNIVSVTVDSVPNLEGGRGLAARKAVVLQASRVWEVPLRGGDTGAKVLVAIEHQVKTTTYSPAAYVSAYDSGTTTLTIDPALGLFATGDTAADHFEAGDKITMWNLGDASTRDALTISTVTGNTIVLTGGLTNASYVSGETVIEAQAYTAVVAAQKLHAFIADTTPDLDGDEPDVYV